MEFTPPSNEVRKVIYRKLRLNPDKLAEIEIELKQWIFDQPHLPHDIDDNIISAFAAYSKGSLPGIKESKRRLDAYYSVRGAIPALYENRDPMSADLMKSGLSLVHAMCPTFTPDYCRVYVAKLLDSNPKAFDFNAIARRILLLHELTMMLDVKTGIYLVADLSGVSVNHFLEIIVTQARSLMHCVQNVYPIRIKKIIFINLKPFSKALLEKLVLPLVTTFKSKLASRIVLIFAEDTVSLAKEIPLSILPSDMGGTASSSEEMNNHWNAQLRLHREWFLSEGSAKTDESKRIEQNSTPKPGCISM